MRPRGPDSAYAGMQRAKVNHSGVPLRRRLFLLVLASVVPLLSFGCALQFLQYRHEIAATGNQSLNVARSMSAQLEQQLQTYINTLQVVAAATSLQAGDFEIFRKRTLPFLTREFPGSDFLLVGQDGREFINTHLPQGTPLPFRVNMETTRQVFASGRPVISNLFRAASDGRPLVSIDVPVLSADKTVTYVATLNPSLGDFTGIIRRQSLASGWIASVYDRLGDNVARLPPNELPVGHKPTPSVLGPLTSHDEGFTETTTYEGVHYLTAYSHDSRFGWSAAVGLPRSELTEPALTAALRTLGAGTAWLAFGLALALSVARRIAGPIDSLRGIATAEAFGFAPDPVATGLPEADEVARALAAAGQERKQAELRIVDAQRSAEETLAALARSQTQLERAQRLAHLGSFVTDLVTGHIDVSEETYRLFGITHEDRGAAAENWLDFVRPEDREAVQGRAMLARQGICPEPIEFQIVRPDGDVRTLHNENELIIDESGNPRLLAGTLQDVTERRQVEQQLRQAQKMEAIGNLTGGMAHDFNNLLGVIIGNLDYARTRMEQDIDLIEVIGDAHSAAWHGADLTRRLLAFARRQPLSPERVDVNELIPNTIRLLKRLLGENVTVSLVLAPETWPVVVDPAQLETSLANLATNARDAMPRGGRIIIATNNRHLDSEYVATHVDVREGDYVLVEVSDTGTGMSAETLSRVFEPFFTTKEAGKGSGLGLSMVFGFIRQSGGHITVYSELGAGTTFRLYLPRATGDAVAREPIRVSRAEQGGGETVLVVEDNVSMRSIVLRQLRDLGYRPVESDSATQALHILQRAHIDLLFTDIVMPGGLDGVELARLVSERWPVIKIVLTSGFPQERINGDGVELKHMRLLSKPYSRQELAAALRAAFGA